MTTNINSSNDYIQTLPIPDAIILEGNYAKEILLESGYPKSILHVCGSARMMGLNEIMPFKKNIEKKINILVAFGANDYYPIIHLCLGLSKLDSNYNFI